MRSRPTRRARPATRHTAWFRLTTAAGSAAMLSTLGLAGVSLTATHAASTARMKLVDDSSSCQLGNGVKHVVQIVFDNVHYFRDNPNVPSDLELMPNLLHFFENNGTFLSNNHTPLIAHTADDILTTLTGLYGDRQGVGIANDYQSYNTDGPNGSFNTSDSASGFTYWTGQINDTADTPSPNRDTNPNMVYSAVPPATAHPAVTPNTVTPAPWVPFTRAGCNVGNVSTANVELENVSPDIATAFGPTSPEQAQLQANLKTDSFADQTVADYVGVAVHCAAGNAFCSTARGDRGLNTTPSATAVTDSLPQEPGGYSGFQALYGHRYVAPQLGAGTPNLSRNGFQVTNAAGNLVDLNGNQINGAFLFPPAPGFPGFSHINAPQTLAYMSDMLESGVPVVGGYISDVHGNEHIPALSSVCAHAPSALPSGTPCYIAQAAYYNAAFGTFFNRLAADGINASNTLFIVSSDEGDHEAGANVGRAIQPTPANCDGVTVTCSYPAGSFGELSGNITGLLATQAGDTTPYSLENDTAPEFYVNGAPGPFDPTVRKLERDVSGLTAFNPYTNTTQPITNFIADPTEEAILHFVDADPARTPTFALFGKPDYFWQDLGPSCTGSCVTQTTSFAYDHGAYAAEINTNYVGFAGPGVANLGLDGQAPNTGPNSAGPDSGQVEVVDSGTTGTWVDETDIRPTMMYLTGLTDDYEHDGRVITEILSHPNSALSGSGVAGLGACYKQLNSSVGQFGASTLQASTTAVESTSAGDLVFRRVNDELFALELSRDALALKIKKELEDAAFNGTPILAAQAQTLACQAIIGLAGDTAKNA